MKKKVIIISLSLLSLLSISLYIANSYIYDKRIIEFTNNYLEEEKKCNIDYLIDKSRYKSSDYITHRLYLIKPDFDKYHGSGLNLIDKVKKSCDSDKELKDITYELQVLKYNGDKYVEIKYNKGGITRQTYISISKDSRKDSITY
jgi:hypothetical protein